MEAAFRIHDRKKTGSYYSPSNLSLYVASKMAPLLPKDRKITILDPAVGNGALLFAFKQLVDPNNTVFAGVDINAKAVECTSLLMNKENLYSHIFYTDALSPYNLDLRSGWNTILKRLKISSFDAIISNPPWGADFELTKTSALNLSTAIGQFDIYDLFLELSIDLLSDGGVYGFIVPDSIYRKEHYAIRKKIMSETTIKYITRIGEFLFEGVNTSVSVIIGVKSKPDESNIISCTHLPNKIAKQIASNSFSFEDADALYAHQCTQKFFVDSNYSLSIDIELSDIEIISQLDKLPHLCQFLVSHRGVELSKKGNVIQCPICQKWMPTPKQASQEIKCRHCGSHSSYNSYVYHTIINKTRRDDKDCYHFLSGEDLGRFIYHSKSYISTNYDGINYKDISLYSQPKILVRKTGVGITAVLDYNNNIVNQVVYILTLKSHSFKVPLEFFIAVLNSRIITYYIIKKYGSSNWCTHPYLSQTMVNELPMPNFKTFTEGDWRIVNNICHNVKDIYQKGYIGDEVDIAIEKDLLNLYKIKRNYFFDILNTISSVEQLLPFKRLLKIPKEVWATVI